MVNRLLLLVFLAVPYAPPGFAAAPHTAPAIFAQMDQMTAALSEITGWKPRKKVPANIISKTNFERYLKDQLRDSSTQKELKQQETALKMLGLVPDDFDLAQQTADVLAEQAAAYYDYRKKKLFVIDATPEGDDQRLALVHELAHALADQQHALGKYLQAAAANPDEASAREAVMEGQATWLTWAFEEKRAGRRAEVPPGLIDQLTQPFESSQAFPALSAAPLYLRESLLFPYNAGARFQDAVFRRLGRPAFEEVFAHGPRSTQQIMHPAAYLDDRDAPLAATPSYEEILGARGKQYKGVIQSSLGEFEHVILLRQHLGREYASIASHWRGGGFRLYEEKTKSRNPKKPLLIYWSSWDSPTAAQQYFDLYQRVQNAKWKNVIIESKNATEIRGESDSGKFVLRLRGTSVQSVEGMR